MRNGIKDKSRTRISVFSRSRKMIHASITNTFLAPPLIDIFMEASLSTKAFGQVLEGTFKCTAGTDAMAQHLITALQCPITITLI